jgi:hypothetical protein
MKRIQLARELHAKKLEQQRQLKQELLMKENQVFFIEDHI